MFIVIGEDYCEKEAVVPQYELSAFLGSVEDHSLQKLRALLKLQAVKVSAV